MRQIVLGIALLWLAALPALAEDVLHMKDGRTLKGTVVSADDKVVKLKMKFGTMTFKRAEVDRIQRGAAGGGSSSSTAETADAPFRNPFLNYQIAKPGRDWIYKQSPPEPLSDLLIYNGKLHAELTVMILADDNPEALVTEGNLPLYTAAIRKKLQEKYNQVERASAEVFQFKGHAAFKVVFNAVTKINQEPFTTQQIVFKTRERKYYLFSSAPRAAFETVRPEFDKIVDSFAFIEAKASDGNTYSQLELLYTIEKPARWTFGSIADGGVRLNGPGGELVVEVKARRFYDDQPLRHTAKQRQATLASQHGDFKLLSEKPTNVLEMVAHELRYTAANKEHHELILHTDNKLYQLISHYPTGGRMRHAGALRKVTDTFRIQRDRTSKASIKEGFQAIDHFDEGDRHFYGKGYATAAEHYKRAIAVFPNYAAAINNLALCHGRQGQAEVSLKLMRRAYGLYPENLVLRKNLAISYNNYAISQANAGDNKGALASYETALRLDPTNQQFKKNVAAVHNNFGIQKLNQGNYTSAAVSFRKVLKLEPGNQRAKQNLSTCYYNKAVGFVNKRLYRQALSPLNQALKYYPGNGQARGLRDKILNHLKSK